ncbi:hypothetical protein GCM10007877_14790 [Marinibactrum halimedae]|uniref:Uncharacterized protein n=1 Tax=Marinibactrum halimedae TaxID=1444977 RepID=A0AA37T963_9GAMM|nr:hypothetical protein GCM10007877_14790 [Marinibactrum halimedae]
MNKEAPNLEPLFVEIAYCDRNKSNNKVSKKKTLLVYRAAHKKMGKLRAESKRVNDAICEGVNYSFMGNSVVFTTLRITKLD